MCVDVDVVGVFFCSSRACNVTCDTCTPTRSVYIPKSRSLSWMCVEIKKRARRETKSGIRIQTERMKNCETKTEKKCGLCTRTLHALTRWFFSSILLLLYSYIHRFIITDCSYQWRPVSFIVDCVRWAYQAESFFFQTYWVSVQWRRHTKNELDTWACVHWSKRAIQRHHLSPTRSPYNRSTCIYRAYVTSMAL